MTLKEKLKLTMADPIRWIETFIKIPDKKGKVVPFKLNPQQRYFMKNMDKFNIVLKARQLGITSVVCGYSLYITHTKPNSTCLLMAHSMDGVRDIFGKLKAQYNNMHGCVRLKTINNNRTELSFENGSRIICCTCGSKDVARGSTLAFAHLSEVAFMNENFPKQFLAIEQALAPDAKMVLESTANGLNIFSEYWNRATTGESPLWKPFFFPWQKDHIMHAEQQRTYAEQYIAINGKPLDESELTDKEIGLLHDGATLNQLMWRRLKISNTSEEQFNQEFPSNPTEAFISTGSNVFSAAIIHERLGTLYLNKVKPLPEKTDPIIRKYRQFFNVWKYPVHKQKYYIGVDTAEGLGGSGDYSVICVLDADGYQCAEWRSNKVKPYEFTDIVIAIAHWYNDGLLIVERASAGHTVLDKLHNDHKYHNIYKYKEFDHRGNTKRKRGYETNSKTKPIMISDFQEWFETKQCFVNSKDLLEEMKLYQMKDGSFSAASGHDDTVMAFAMCIQGIKSGQYYYKW